MKSISLEATRDGLLLLAASTGAGSEALEWLSFIDSYSAGIGVMLTLFFGLAGLAIHVFSVKESKLYLENKKEIEQINERFDKNDDILNDIYRMLSKNKDE